MADGNVEIKIPDDLAAGVYSNVTAVWHSPHEFTPDFAVIEPTQDEAQGMNCRVVSRVRIPSTVMFDLLRALNENMTRYEARFGEIRRIDQRNEPEGETEG